jgi:hypothetical protein
MLQSLTLNLKGKFLYLKNIILLSKKGRIRKGAGSGSRAGSGSGPGARIPQKPGSGFEKNIFRSNTLMETLFLGIDS